MRAFRLLLLFICFLGMSQVYPQWDTYPTYEEYVDIMNKFGTDYPGLCKIVEIGESVQGRKLLCAKISDSVDTHEKEPQFFYLSSLHGDELTGYILLLRLINYLLANYEKDTLVTRLASNVEIWINPLANPDGTYRGGDSTVQEAVKRNSNDKDLNRNFDDPVKGVCGLYDEYEKETEGFINFISQNNFVMSAHVHCGTEGVLYPLCSLYEIHPDDRWFRYVGHDYIDTVNAYSPWNYFEENPMSTICYHCSSEWYITHGTILDYLVYYQQCRCIVLELSIEKILPENKLLAHWDYNYRSLLNYIEQVLYGIRGTVTDSLTGEALYAKVFVEDHDKDSSYVYAHLPHGDFYRPILEGTYSVTFSAEGYYPKTISDVEVVNNKATVLDVRLRKIPTNVVSNSFSTPNFSINVYSSTVKIAYSIEKRCNVRITLFDLAGRLVKIFKKQSFPGEHTIVWNGLDDTGNAVSNGGYIVRIDYGTETLAQRFILSR